MNESLSNFSKLLNQAKGEVGKIILGQDEVIESCLLTIISQQHALIEGVPGVGKTLLVKTLAKVLGCDFNRIQFTPDLMPGDITGTNVFDLQKGEFNLFKGPIFTTFLLGDEINRAPAKTQSATLQAMQERKVSIDRVTYDLPSNFTLFATQNPEEYEGTYPLPEAQKDRFMFCIPMLPLAREHELELASRMLGQREPDKVLEQNLVQTVLGPEELQELRLALEQVQVKDNLISYMVDLVRETRESEWIQVGAGPRATQCFAIASRVKAILDGRDFVIPEDVQQLTHAILGHRLILKPEVEVEGVTIRDVVDRISQKVAVPR
jgi:MoxR-like ATPase